ncbi:hypothetical protein D0T84_00750 [Dysgonomonas sp. 521]|uniref:hypothetical protein n=1 Tax=Dysgonomonas sp. 521 TaxID=2302932 RepID=UPI0013D6A66A|nr:hypothetical protein [Dysgonomonas sp. 521]NDV93446.1 hypothetical protein [Dysgonomonas sp. 521]
MINIDIDLNGLDDTLKEIEAYEQRFIFRLQRIGEQYVATARQKGSYDDHTGNLRNANSYRLYKDGRVLFQSIGSSITGEFLDNYITGIGLELVCGNGMEYCTYVEGKGYDVVSSGFLKAESEARKI